MGTSFVYGLHWVFVVGALMFSWRRSRHFLHPHFLFTGMLVFFLLDFLMRGYDDPNIEYIPESDLLIYQLMILSILTIIVFATSFVKYPLIESYLHFASNFSNLKLKSNARRPIFLVSFVILGAELYKRLYIVDWSLDEVIRQSLGPRGDRDWTLEIFAGNYLFAIITILLPIAAVAAAYLFATGQRAGRVVALALFVLVVAILVTDGSRTPVAISFFSLGLLWMLRYRSLVRRAGIMGLAMGVMIGAFAIMYTYRSSGYIDQNNVWMENELVGSTHQDDNYYRAIYAYDYADRTGKRWDPLFFFLAIASNPIPRAIWPGKPLMDEKFYNGFKLDYVTNSFLGETVAMTGASLSVVFAPLLGFLGYLILFNSLRILRMPLGLAVYLIVALYVYMVIRSMPNAVAFAYLPAAAVAITLALDRRQKSLMRDQSTVGFRSTNKPGLTR